MANAYILRTGRLGFPWATQDPFLFCVHHLDFYPEGNTNLGPATSLTGRNIGNDFAIKDGWRMYHGSIVPGFPAHPHRGFETVTFVLQGLVDHADSNGAAGRYGNRDVQWMTAGSGLQHSEMFPLLHRDKKNTFELFQIWLNLPASKKFVTPNYKMLWGETIPKLTLSANNETTVEIDIVAGKIGDVQAPAPAPDSWAANPENEVGIWQMIMQPGADWELPVSTGKINRTLYFFEGETLRLNETSISPGTYAELDASRKIKLINGTKKSRILVLQGVPIGEPVAQYGPFVMNTEEEIRQTYSDFRRTQFGGWPWPRTDMVHGATRGRFAKYDDGTEIDKD